MIERNINDIAGILCQNVGNTPLLPLLSLSKNLDIKAYAKMEMKNPSGSVKDRSATNIIVNAIYNGEVNAETTIIESSSGNMGIALGRICKMLGLKSYIVIDPHINPHAKKLLQNYGSRLIEVKEKDKNQGYLSNRLAKVQELLSNTHNSYWTDQYHNLNVRLAHEHIFTEIVNQLGHAPDYMLVATSTCGTIRGIADAIDQSSSHTTLIAVDAKGSVLFDIEPQERFIPGMGASHPSSFLQKNQIKDHVLISDHLAIETCRNFLDQEGMLIGGSSGAIVAALQQIREQLPPKASVVLLFPDSGERYLDTIYNDNWVKQVMEKVAV
ncbi:MAG TPA: 2,3-diaminopropionate biosynthesis protein SbnA [Sphingobacterium sp.]|nr:2,3-diaminopropionate biosynthesis protein SbnA [Sphingobacterium sp.]